MWGNRESWSADAAAESFPAVVRSVLRDLGFRTGSQPMQEPAPDFLLVAVERGHVALRVAAARERARGAPVIAVLQTSDGELATCALAAGAHTFVACDAPPASLHVTLRTLLGLNAGRPRAR
jgi:DNA-binding NarL/FixJ family response regulator